MGTDRGCADGDPRHCATPAPALPLGLVDGTPCPTEGTKTTSPPITSSPVTDSTKPGSKGEKETSVTCPDGSVRRSADQCPLPQKACPGSVVGVAVGEACPPPRPSPPVPVVCWDGSVRAATLDCPAGRRLCPGGLAVPLDEQCAAPTPSRCPKGTVRVLGVCTPVSEPGVSEPDVGKPDVGEPVAREARPGELLFDRSAVTAGDTLFARGAGCRPGSQAVLTAGGELVGRTVADQDGTFETVVQFASFRPGYRPVTAACGANLSAGIDMVLVSADTSASPSSVLLPLFLALSFLAVHYQMAARGRRRARSQRR